MSKHQNKPKTAIDLFCGAGGLTLGLKRAGFKVLAGIEIDPAAAESYRMNHKDVVCLEEDILKIEPRKLLKTLGLKKGELSLLAGCPPCQGFSTLRTKKRSSSVRDSRNNLLFEYLRFVKAMRPKALMMENVPALLKDARMKKLLKEVAKLGYIVDENSVRVEDAADYGVPQRRKRMIMQVMLKGVISQPRKAKKVTVRRALEKANLKKAGKSGDKLHDSLINHTPKVLELIKSIPKNGGSRTSLPDHLVLQCHKEKNSGFKDVYGRMKWDDVSPTITGGCGNPSKGRFLHPKENRAITLREAAILQTFPKNYKFSSLKGRSAIALMIGNALPPLFIKKHASKIADALEMAA